MSDFDELESLLDGEPHGEQPIYSTQGDDSLALLRSIVEKGCEAATYQEDEQCFYCAAQVNYNAPKRDSDHNDGCLFVLAKRAIFHAENGPPPRHVPDLSGAGPVAGYEADADRPGIHSAPQFIDDYLTRWEAAVAEAIKRGAGVSPYPLVALEVSRTDTSPYVIDESLFITGLYLAKFKHAAATAELLRSDYRNGKVLEWQDKVDPDAGVVKASGEPKKYTQERAEAKVRSDPEYLRLQERASSAARERDVCEALVHSLERVFHLRAAGVRPETDVEDTIVGGLLRAAAGRNPSHN